MVYSIAVNKPSRKRLQECYFLPIRYLEAPFNESSEYPFKIGWNIKKWKLDFVHSNLRWICCDNLFTQQSILLELCLKRHNIQKRVNRKTPCSFLMYNFKLDYWTCSFFLDIRYYIYIINIHINLNTKIVSECLDIICVKKSKNIFELFKYYIQYLASEIDFYKILKQIRINMQKYFLISDIIYII